ncbi:acyl-CoA dehydrogenase family protein [Thalassomonas haliotis]|uniref:Acyl-CoA dehydrogenase family protein n=1 Tax=Thalassomonas haliotis TaxID=485448 RepID=A0ABY7V8A5_9GAMM|nr:acyl-CoA dehydrogenase family protein [Thalassomonas haliotis]WDE09875.1 acyl-CoA dehydrogenase family protein [Thalassomonas haliotis]
MIFTNEHLALQRTVQQFVQQEINPYIDEWEAAGQFPTHKIFKKMGDLGLLGINKPVEYGGLGLDYSYAIILAEEIGAAHCGGVPLSITVQTDMATPALASFGSDELRREFLAPSISGDMVSCIAVSEPGAGSDVAAITTTAKKDGDDYIINGAKMWITNATQADYFCLLANTSEGSIHTNKSLIIVPANLPGVSVGEKLKKIGMRSSDTAPVFFDNVRVPQRYRIGEEGKGFTYQMQQFQLERLAGAALCIKGMENCVQSTIDYTRDRQAFGAPLINNQQIHFAMAHAQTDIEALRSLIYRATEELVQGKDVTKLASMAKLLAGKVCRTLPDTCLQFWGGMGFVEESLVNRLYRDYRLTAIAGGAEEVMLGIICKMMNILPTPAKKG